MDAGVSSDTMEWRLKMFEIDELRTLAIQIKKNPDIENRIAKRQGILGFSQPQETLLESVYRLASEGNLLFDLSTIMRKTGLRKDGTPRLAIAKAGANWADVSGGRGYSAFHLCSYDGNTELAHFKLPTYTYDGKKFTYCQTAVPSVPTYIVPRSSQDFILWEPESWQVFMPDDPILCRWLGGLLFVVVAAWDLTSLEASLFSLQDEPKRMKDERLRAARGW